MGRKHCVKGRNCSLRAIPPFPAVFSKDLYCRHVKNQGLFGKGLNVNTINQLSLNDLEEEKYFENIVGKREDAYTIFSFSGNTLYPHREKKKLI